MVAAWTTTVCGAVGPGHRGLEYERVGAVDQRRIGQGVVPAGTGRVTDLESRMGGESHRAPDHRVEDAIRTADEYEPARSIENRSGELGSRSDGAGCHDGSAGPEHRRDLVERPGVIAYVGGIGAVNVKYRRVGDGMGTAGAQRNIDQARRGAGATAECGLGLRGSLGAGDSAAVSRVPSQDVKDRPAAVALDE